MQPDETEKMPENAGQMGAPPRVHVQWLPTAALRKRARLEGGLASDGGTIRSFAINWYEPEYALAATLAKVHVGKGIHSGNLVLQVGFVCDDVREGPGGTLGPADAGWGVKPTRGCEVPGYLHRTPQPAELVQRAWDHWMTDLVAGGAEGEAVLHAEAEMAQERNDIQARVNGWMVAREKQVAAQVLAGKRHPLFNLDRFEEVAGYAPEQVPVRHVPLQPLLGPAWYVRAWAAVRRLFK